MRTLTMVILSFILAAPICSAESPERQAEAFHQMLMSLCVNNIANLDALRDRLKGVPSFPEEQGAVFLANRTGTAWPVPDKSGLFVLSLLDSGQCAILARRASSTKVREQFLSFVTDAPSPLVYRKVSEASAMTEANGEAHTIQYEWSAEADMPRLVFTLTTSDFEEAQIQAMGSVVLIHP